MSEPASWVASVEAAWAIAFQAAEDAQAKMHTACCAHTRQMWEWRRDTASMIAHRIKYGIVETPFPFWYE